MKILFFAATLLLSLLLSAPSFAAPVSNAALAAQLKANPAVQGIFLLARKEGFARCEGLEIEKLEQAADGSGTFTAQLICSNASPGGESSIQAEISGEILEKHALVRKIEIGYAG